MTSKQAKLLKLTIKAIEDSKTIDEAKDKLGVKTRTTIYDRLKWDNLVIVRDTRLVVVKDDH